ncbi:MAG TPA: carboxymuconolactone decarboxylase family protein [Bacteroidales bacterium]|nr:carboxymuconolactone decarboxylase family protein [Bacteroidales bacterium]HQH10434.1 carboxymuconolactone decarboxylase family protein [Bacteroidales bacterium]
MFLILTIVGCSMGTLNAQPAEKTNRTLTGRQESIITISAFTAKGDLVSLKPALEKGLETGLTINEIKEVLVHLYAYCGFPRSIRGLQTFMEVVDARKANGIMDETGVEPSPVKEDRNKYERGKEILGELTGMPQTGPRTGYAAFAPVIEVFLKEHLFADIFERDVLTYAERELVTISVISAIGSAEPMLRSHLAICLNVGFTSGQLKEFVGVLQSTVGKKKAKAAGKILEELLDNRN